MLAPAVGAIAIQHRRRRLAAERLVVAFIAPQTSGFRAATTAIQHRVVIGILTLLDQEN
jgi:hypothetical protein